MALPAGDAQSQERELQVCRRVPESKPASSEAQHNATVQKWGIKTRVRDMHACRAVVLLAWWRHARMVPVTEMLEWKDVGSSRSAGGGSEVLVARGSAWSSVWGLMRS